MKARARRDIAFYERSADIFNFAGRPAPQFPYDPAGLEAPECFQLFDSTGQIRPAREPERVARMVVAKASINLHIKMWAQGISMGLFHPSEFRNFLAPCDPPDWIWKAIDNQLTAGNKPV